MSEHNENHIVPVRVYVAVFLTLIAMTWVTAWISTVDLGPFNIYVALSIAIFKASLVILFFMHVKYQSNLIKITVGAGFFTFLALVTMTLLDYISRAWGLW